jgi:hypothetical protein
MGRKFRYHPNRLDHGYADLSGSRHTGKPRFSPFAQDDADESFDRLCGFLDYFVRVMAPRDYLVLWDHFARGVSAAEFARRNGTHRGTEGRSIVRMLKGARVPALAALAALQISRGEEAPGFLLCPQSGQLVAGLDPWSMALPSLTARYDRPPTVEEIREFILSYRQVLFEEDAYLGVWSDMRGDWRLMVCKRLAPSGELAA